MERRRRVLWDKHIPVIEYLVVQFSHTSSRLHPQVPFGCVFFIFYFDSKLTLPVDRARLDDICLIVHSGQTSCPRKAALCVLNSGVCSLFVVNKPRKWPRWQAVQTQEFESFVSACQGRTYHPRCRQPFEGSCRQLWHRLSTSRVFKLNSEESSIFELKLADLVA